MREKVSKINIIDFIIKINDEELFNEENKISELQKEVSKISELQKEENKISELQMHKILYIIYGNFYAKFEKELFKNANFEAWRYGPVEVDFRKYFNSNIKINKKLESSIYNKFNAELKTEEKNFLFKIIRKALRFSPWSLVQFTHDTDPWLKNFDENKNNIPIPSREIQEWFKNNQLD